jgi:TonB family protein
VAVAAGAILLASQLGWATPPEVELPYDVAPREIRVVPPRYPREAWPLKYEGYILVYARVDLKGRVRQARIASGFLPALDSAAVEAARLWRFTPALKNGKPIEAAVAISPHFVHPSSGNLARPENRVSVARAVVRGADGLPRPITVRVEASATLDSVTGQYRYYYRVANDHASTQRVAALFIRPLPGIFQPAPGDYRDLAIPPHWNGAYGCGEDRQALGWLVWDRDSLNLHSAFAIAPGDSLSGFGFQTSFPPGVTRWFAQPVNLDDLRGPPWGCFTSDTTSLALSPLQGKIVGPVASAAGPTP